MILRKVLTAFFTFLGYCTFVALIGAAAIWYVGYTIKQKNQAIEVNKGSPQAEVPMTPVKTEDADTIAALPHFEPISKSSKKSAPQASARKPAKWTPKKTKTAKPAAPKPVPAVSVPTVLYTSLDDEPASARKPAKWTPKKTKTAKPAAPKAKKIAIVQADMPGTSIVTWKATDAAHTNTRAGRGYVPDVSKTTALQEQVRLRKDIDEIKRAAESIRNPPVWGSSNK